MPLPVGVNAVLVDIEGTTTPVSFVYDVLFPYAAKRLEAFCAKAAGQPEADEAIQMLRREHQQEETRPGSATAPPLRATSWIRIASPPG